jgi:ABC-type thiamin/hydroxymethylpyrimidine transport system permease subunit
MKMRNSMIALLTLTSLLAAGSALAHSGEHVVSGFTAAVSHLLTEPFHLGMIAAALVAGIGAFVIWKKSKQH